MLIETMARRTVITDVGYTYLFRRHVRDEMRNVIRPVRALWKKLQEPVTLESVKHAIEIGGVPDEWAATWRDDTFNFVSDDLTPQWVRNITLAGDSIARKVNRIQRKQFGFNPTMTSVKVWIDTNGGRLIVELTTAQYNSIHALLQAQIAWGVTSPYILAERIRPMVGLTQRESAAVTKFMMGLREEGIAESAITSRAAKYADFLHKGRAERIARTEISNAYNFGQMDSLSQAAGEGWLPGEPEKEWMAGGQNPCDDCLDNEAEGSIPLNQTFSSGHDHPTCHPSCECTLGYSVAR